MENLEQGTFSRSFPPSALLDENASRKFWIRFGRDNVVVLLIQQ